MSPTRRAVLLLVGCLFVGVGVGLLLTADYGSDGYSTLVNGLAIWTGWPFFLCNTIVSVTFVAVGWLGGVRPGIGTLAQVVLVGLAANVVLELLTTPVAGAARVGLLLLAVPVIAVGIATYLGANLGAGPFEAVALAFDPPIPFKWMISILQFLTAAGGWLLGGTIGLATVAVILLLGPLAALASRLLRLDVHQGEAHHEPV